MYDQESRPTKEPIPAHIDLAHQVAKQLISVHSHSEQVQSFNLIRDILLKERAQHIEAAHAMIKETSAKIEEIQDGNNYIEGINQSASLKPNPVY